MRVTDQMLTELRRSGLASARDRLSRAESVASSGLRVTVPSDDPSASALARRSRNEETRIGALLESAQVGASSLAAAESSLSEMGGALARARELAIQAANGTHSATDRASIGAEIASLRESILSMANVRVDGEYVLGGLRSGAPPFDALGNFVGDRNVREIEVAPGIRVATSVSAGDALAPAGGLDVLASLSRLEVALSTNDLPSIQVGIEEMVAADEQILSARADAGLHTQRLEQATALGTRLRDAAREVRAQSVEADAFEAFSELTLAQSALERAVAIASRLPLPGLAART